MSVNADTDVRMVLWVRRDLYTRLADHAAACGEPLPEFLRHRLTDSLPLDPGPQAAPRRGCAGNGEVARVASPALTNQRVQTEMKTRQARTIRLSKGFITGDYLDRSQRDTAAPTRVALRTAAGTATRRAVHRQVSLAPISGLDGTDEILERDRTASVRHTVASSK